MLFNYTYKKYTKKLKKRNALVYKDKNIILEDKSTFYIVGGSNCFFN